MDLRKPEPRGDLPHIDDLEAAAVVFHRHEAGEAVSAWNDGLGLYLRSMDVLLGYETKDKSEIAMVAVLLRAWQTIQRAFDNALKGYYPQSLNLL